MKLSVRIYRIAVVPTQDLFAALDVPYGGAEEVTDRFLESRLRESFGPLAPGMRVFWGRGSLTPVGKEVMGFDITEPEVAQAGFVNATPSDPAAVARADGAIEAELARWGLWAAPEGYEWRCSYDVRGN